MGAKIKESVMTPFKGSSITKAKGDGGGEENSRSRRLFLELIATLPVGEKKIFLSVVVAGISSPIPKV